MSKKSFIMRASLMVLAIVLTMIVGINQGSRVKAATQEFDVSAGNIVIADNGTNVTVNVGENETIISAGDTITLTCSAETSNTITYNVTSASIQIVDIIFTGNHKYIGSESAYFTYAPTASNTCNVLMTTNTTSTTGIEVTNSVAYAFDMQGSGSLNFRSNSGYHYSIQNTAASATGGCVKINNGEMNINNVTLKTTGSGASGKVIYIYGTNNVTVNLYGNSQIIANAGKGISAVNVNSVINVNDTSSGETIKIGSSSNTTSAGVNYHGIYTVGRVNVINGRIMAYGCFAIETRYDANGIGLSVRGGSIRSYSTSKTNLGTTIKVSKKGAVDVSGGTISSEQGNAIDLAYAPTVEHTALYVRGGQINTILTSPSTSYVSDGAYPSAINNMNSFSKIDITRGKVCSYYTAINNEGILYVSDGTICDGQAVNSSNYALNTSSSIYNAGKCYISDSADVINNAGSSIKNEYGTVEINGGVVCGLSTNTATAIWNIAGTVNISGGQVFSTRGQAIYISSSSNAEGAIVNISGGYVFAGTSDKDATDTPGSKPTVIDSYSTLNITGGTVFGFAKVIQNNSTNVAGNKSGIVKMTGGTVEVRNTVSGTAISSNYRNSNGGECLVYIGGGTIKSPEWAVIDKLSGSGDVNRIFIYGTPSITGTVSYESYLPIANNGLDGEDIIYYTGEDKITVQKSKSVVSLNTAIVAGVSSDDDENRWQISSVNGENVTLHFDGTVLRAVTKYTLSFVTTGLQEGPIDDIIGHAGMVVELPSTLTSTDDSKAFLGWTDGEEIYRQGESYTFENINVEMTALFCDKAYEYYIVGEYVSGKSTSFDIYGKAIFEDTACSYILATDVNISFTDNDFSKVLEYIYNDYPADEVPTITFGASFDQSTVSCSGACSMGDIYVDLYDTPTDLIIKGEIVSSHSTNAIRIETKKTVTFDNALISSIASADASQTIYIVSESAYDGNGTINIINNSEIENLGINVSTIKIDGGEYIVNISDSIVKGKIGINVSSKCTLNINDDSTNPTVTEISTTSAVAIYVPGDDAIINVNGGAIKTAEGVSSSYAILVVGKSTLNINGGEIIGDTGFTGTNQTGIVSLEKSGAVLNMHGGTIDGKPATAISLDSEATANIYDGLITSSNGYEEGATIVVKNGTLNITGGIIKSDNRFRFRAINNFLNGNVDIRDGEIFGGIINSGNFVITGTAGIIDTYQGEGTLSPSNQSFFENKGGIFTMTGGTIVSETHSYAFEAVDANDYNSINISGGTIKNNKVNGVAILIGNNFSKNVNIFGTAEVQSTQGSAIKNKGVILGFDENNAQFTIKIYGNAKIISNSSSSNLIDFNESSFAISVSGNAQLTSNSGILTILQRDNGVPVIAFGGTPTITGKVVLQRSTNETLDTTIYANDFNGNTYSGKIITIDIEETAFPFVYADDLIFVKGVDDTSAKKFALANKWALVKEETNLVTKQYAITVNTNDERDENYVFLPEDGVVTLTPLEKEGYNLGESYYTNSDGTGTNYNVSSTINVAEETWPIYLYSLWTIGKYDISFNRGNIENVTITGDDPTTLSQKEYNSVINLPTSNYIADGYNFTGWNDGTNTYQPGDEYTVEGAVEFSAQWETAYSYIIKHYQQNLDDNDYTYKEEETIYTSTLTISKTALEGKANSYTGFILKEITDDSFTIAEDGTNIINLYYDRETYDWTYYLDGTSDGEQEVISYRYGSSYNDALANPEEKIGHTFDGWYDKPSNSGQTATVIPTYEPEITIDSRMDLYAYWNINQYIITFDTQATSITAPAQKTVSYGQEIGALDELAKTGYTFDGWWTTTGYGQGANPGEKVTSSTVYEYVTNITLYLKLKAKTTAITLNANGGNANSSTVATYNSAELTSCTIPTKTGYTLDGFYTSVTDGEKVINAEGDLVSNASYAESAIWQSELSELTLYATWTINEYTYTFQNYDESVLKTETVDYGTVITAPVNNPTRPNSSTHSYSFTGWNPTYSEDATMPANNVTYIAQYTAQPLPTHTISFSCNMPSATGTAPSEITKIIGESIILPNNPYSLTEYHFFNWSCDNGETYMEEGASYEVTGDVTFVAYLVINKYTVTFYDYDNAVIDQKTVDYNSTVLIPSNPTREEDDDNSYSFDSWISLESSPACVQGMLMPNSNISYKASYKATPIAKVTISFSIGDGVTGNAPTTITRISNSEFVLPTNTAVKKGYSFVCWTDGIDNYNEGSTYNVANSDVKLTAKWAINSYTYTFYDEDGETILKKEKIEYGKAIIAPNNPTKAKDDKKTYMFDSWSPTYSEGMLIGDKDISFVAKYVSEDIPSKSNIGLIIAIVIPSVVAIGGASTFFIIKKKKKSV